MSNCIGCRYWVADKPNNGRGECWQQTITKSGTERPRVDGMSVRDCSRWKLLEIGQMKGRSARRFVWDANNNVRL